MQKKFKALLLTILIILSALFLFGCQSTDDSNAYLNYSEFPAATFDYNAKTDETKVVFRCTITNDTIYNIESIRITVKLYNNSVFLGEQKLNYSRKFANGEQYNGSYSFYANGEVDCIEYSSWSANHASFWDTYKLWIIISAVLSGVAAIIYIILMIVNDLECGCGYGCGNGCGEGCCDNLPIVLILLPSIGGIILGVLGIVFSYWVPVLIVLGAVLAFGLVVLIAHLIKYLIQDVWMCDIDCPCGSSYGGYSMKNYGKFDYYEDGGNNKADEADEDDEDDDYDEYYEDSESDEPIILQKSSSKAETKANTNALAELDALIGLESVKNQIKRIRAVLIKNKDLDETPNLHMCFYGNPGTGKTVVARLMADIFYEIGILPTNKLIETDRSGLCGEYVGQTAAKTHKKVKSAMGGVLFIDEAYTLSSNGENDYGKEAIAALLKDMEDYKGKFCVILAGYKEEMEEMIALNPGFDSRINRKIVFPDYTIDEQMQIFNSFMTKRKYEITDDAKAKVRNLLDERSRAKKFANARTVRNVLDELIEIQALRTISTCDRTITAEDVDNFLKEN